MKTREHIAVLLTMILMVSSCRTEQSSQVMETSDVMEKRAKENDLVLMLSERAMQLAGVTIGTVQRDGHGETRRVVGRLVNGSAAERTLTPRFSGRILRMMAKEIGRPVRISEAIAELYSPELSALMGEHLLLLKNTSPGGTTTQPDPMVERSRQKLLRSGMNAKQVNELEHSGKVPAGITWYSEAAGTISEVKFQEGSWVTAGTTVVTLQAVSALRVEAGVYPAELDAIKAGQQMVIRFANGATSTAILENVMPDAGEDVLTRPVRLRVQQLPANAREGDPAEVMIPSGEERGLTIPDEAVARSGARAGVFRRIAPGTFQLQPVVTTESAAGRTGISSGLKPGDTIALSGAWLLYAELSSKLGISPLSQMINQP